jgi:hypothetical protein
MNLPSPGPRCDAIKTMSTDTGAVAVLIPTLGRPHRVQALLDNLNETTPGGFAVYFIVEKEDVQTAEAVRRAQAGLIFNAGPPTYASCINTAYRETVEPYLLLGADDIVFVERWLEEALIGMQDPGIGVVGTEDPRAPVPDHSAHSLVRRRYIEERSGCLDLRNTVLYPYKHGFTDHELAGVAKARRAYVYRPSSRIEHHHPGWDSLGRVRGGTALDATYRKGNRHHRRDTITFIERSRAWTDLIDSPSPADIRVRKFIHRNRGVRGAVRYGLRRFVEAIAEGLRA